MKALILNCTLKKSPEPSSTEALSSVVAAELTELGCETEILRVLDYSVLPGVKTDEGEGDDWPQIHEKILRAEILILASPTWIGQASSVTQRVIERMDAMLFETDDDKRPVAYNHVAGFVATGNEDGAKHVIAEMAAALIEIGFTIPGQSWTYYNGGSAMAPTYVENDNDASKKRPHRNARLAAQNIVAVTRALLENPIAAPKK